ncbi:MAG: TOBE domain-containing protein [Alphaproteobacteria bacterium]
MLQGAIADCTYLGTDFRLAIDADGLPPDAARILVTVPAWRCHLVPEPGRRVFLGWEADAPTLVIED